MFFFFWFVWLWWRVANFQLPELLLAGLYMKLCVNKILASVTVTSSITGAKFIDFHKQENRKVSKLAQYKII